MRFDQGFSDNLPYTDASFDRVFSSFMFHHLPADARRKTLEEVRRVLAPEGSLHLADFEQPSSPGILARHLASVVRQAGFSRASRVSGGGMLLGLLRFGYYEAVVPA